AVGPRKSRDPYRTRELELLQAIADQTAVALANARLVTDLKLSNEEIRALNTTLEERNEQLREMDRVKTDFITIASHELRTPLTQVLGYADLLQMMSQAENVPGNDLAPITDSVLRASQRLNEVVTQMLDVSQLDVDALQLNLQDTSLESVLKTVVQSFSGALQERRLALSAKNITPLPRIQGDAERLNQAFRQIISNAIKFTPDGGSIQIVGQHYKDGHQPEAVEIVVIDSGVGIAPSYHELVFEKFFRVGSTALHSTGTTKFMGAGPGLGLPIAKGIVEAHGGRIWVESPGFDQERCPGAKLHVLLPVRAPAVSDKDLSASGVSR
ncbi:MAG TPA: HAMP domain-containing sensor histidine kinase, partial [Anaerolineales bacterium]|nr:HAMP domain-containing sensor histidine kinase [Anaerolineales bacterium]